MNKEVKPLFCCKLVSDFGVFFYIHKGNLNWFQSLNLPTYRNIVAGKVVDLGSLIDVFVISTNPVTRKIVGEDFDAFSILKSLNIDTKNRHLVKLIYFSQEISKPIIIELYSKFQIAASIVYADIEKFRDEAVGIMIVDLNGEETQRKQAIEYLQNLDIEVSELRGEA